MTFLVVVFPLLIVIYPFIQAFYIISFFNKSIFISKWMDCCFDDGECCSWFGHFCFLVITSPIQIAVFVFTLAVSFIASIFLSFALVFTAFSYCCRSHPFVGHTRKFIKDLMKELEDATSIVKTIEIKV